MSKLFNIVWAAGVIACGVIYIESSNWHALTWMVTAVISSLFYSKTIKDLDREIDRLRSQSYYEAYEVIKDRKKRPFHILFNN